MFCHDMFWLFIPFVIIRFVSSYVLYLYVLSLYVLTLYVLSLNPENPNILYSICFLLLGQANIYSSGTLLAFLLLFNF
jgi:hypothetical protein